MEFIKSVWSEWEMVKILGRGSFGTVYEAVRKDHNLESRAAIKVISIPQNESEIDSLKSEGMSMDATKTYLQNVVDDFVEEIRLMESFKGVQNIVSVEDYKVIEKSGEIGWDIYIRMELLTSLTTYAADQNLTEKDIIKLGSDICTALELCSKRDIIHRDIKPENIFVNSFGDFKLGDFGIARKLENTTGGLSQKGTYNYMAPEVKQGIRYDASVDQYSLGLVLYRYSNKNRLPFLNTDKQLLSPNDRMEAINRRMSGEELPAPCDVSEELADVILRACSYNPGARFSSITDMKKALVSVSEGTNSIEETRKQNEGARSADKEETVSVRNRTEEMVSVRNATATKDTGSINTFTEKKRSKKPLFVAAVLILMIVCGAGAYYRFWLKSDNKEKEESFVEESNDADEPKISVITEADKPGVEPEEKQISEIIENAEKMAGNEDYAGAVSVIEDGLVNFPDSDSMKKKKEEYEQMLAKREKETILGKADDLAQKGDYESAIGVIAEAQEKNTDDKDYEAAYQLYISAYIKSTIEEADVMASEKNYYLAFKKVTDAVRVTGEDASLSVKEKEYEEKYVAEVLSEIDVCLSSEEYDKAEEKLNDAIGYFPDNEDLQEKSLALSNIGPKYLLTVCPPYQTWGWEANDTYTLTGEKYSGGFRFRESDGYAYFNLKGQYDSMEFDIGHIDGQRTEEGTYVFSVDNDIVKTLSVKPDSSIEHIEIPLMGSEQLVIKASDCGYAYAFVNVKVIGNGKVATSKSKPDDGKVRKALLTVCPPYESWGYSSDSAYSLAGDKYSDGFRFSDGNGYVYFNLNHKYSSLEFDVGHIDGERMVEGTCLFYLDDELYDTMSFKPSMLVEHKEIPLNGTKQLTIKPSNHDGCTYAFVNVYVVN